MPHQRQGHQRARRPKTPEGEGVVESLETLKEAVRVKIQDKDEVKHKRFAVTDIKVIKDAQIEDDEVEDKELQELEKLEELDKENMED